MKPLTITKFLEIAGSMSIIISRSEVYKLIKTGQIRAVKVNGKYSIDGMSAKVFLKQKAIQKIKLNLFASIGLHLFKSILQRIDLQDDSVLNAEFLADASTDPV